MYWNSHATNTKKHMKTYFTLTYIDYESDSYNIWVFKDGNYYESETVLNAL